MLVLVPNFPALELVILSDFWQYLFLSTSSKIQGPINLAIWAHNMWILILILESIYYKNIWKGFYDDLNLKA